MVFHSNSPPIFEPILLKTGGFSRIYSLAATGWSFERSPHRQVRSSLPDDWIVRQRRQILCKRKILSGRMLRAKGLDIALLDPGHPRSPSARDRGHPPNSARVVPIFPLPVIAGPMPFPAPAAFRWSRRWTLGGRSRRSLSPSGLLLRRGGNLRARFRLIALPVAASVINALEMPFPVTATFQGSRRWTLRGSRCWLPGDQSWRSLFCSALFLRCARDPDA